MKSSAFASWWRGLPEKLQDAVTAAIERLEERGVLLRHPESSDVRSSKHGNMRELRIDTRGEAIRVFYAFDPRRRAVVLVGDSVGTGRKLHTHHPAFAIPSTFPFPAP